MKRVLVLPGGGALGIMQLRVLEEIERKSNKAIHEIFDLIVGTSVGAVNGAVLSYGVPAEDYSNLFYRSVDDIFQRSITRIPWISPIYDRDNFIKMYDVIFPNRELELSVLNTKFMATAVNRINKKTEYFKSWKHNHKLFDVLLRTFAAPYYFGQVLDYESLSIWFDGGMGTANVPIDVAFTECVKMGWFDEKLEITCVTCGIESHEPETHKKRQELYKKMKDDLQITQVLDFVQLVDGGLARMQDGTEKFHRYKIMSENIETFDFRLINTYIEKEHNSLDAVKYKDIFMDYANDMIDQIKYNNWSW